MKPQTQAYALPSNIDYDPVVQAIWSLGITVMEFVEKIPPTFLSVTAPLFTDVSMYPPKVLSFAKECIIQVKETGPSAKRLLEHELVSNIKDETLALQNLFSQKVWICRIYVIKVAQVGESNGI